jgi:dihydrofolate reductase
MHASLDGFVAGPNGEMDWIQLDSKLFEYVGKATDAADTAIYGRITFGMMESYWPTAGENPKASKHDIEHSNWYNNSLKIVFSKTMEQPTSKKVMVIKNNMKEEIEKLKKQSGKNLLLIGSTSIVHAFTELDLVDEYWINVNPVLLGKGMPLFKDNNKRTNLKLLHSHAYDYGVVALQYEVKR